MNIREVTGFEILDALGDSDYDFVLQWSDGWSSKLPNIPKTASIVNQLVRVATASGRHVSDKNLDLAAALLENERKQGEIAQKWVLEQCPAGLKDANGKLSGDNLKLIGDAIMNEFGGDFGKLNEAVALLTQRRQLRYSQISKTKEVKTKTSITGKGHTTAAKELEGDEAIAEYMRTAPLKLRDASGSLGRENADKIAAVIKNELGSKATLSNIDIAVKLLANRKQLTYTEVGDSEAAARALELKDEHERSRSDAQNRHQKPDAGKLKEAAEAKALEHIDKIYKSANREDKIEILQIIRRTKEAKASPLVAQQELVAYGSVQALLAQPPGQKHHEKSFAVDSIKDIIRQEQQFSQQHPESGLALWGRIARTVAEQVTNKVSRGIR